MKPFAFIISLLFAAQGWAQAPPSAAARPSSPAGQTVYRLGADDEIALVVVGEEDFNHTFRVGSDGAVTLPWIGSTKAVGLTTTELQENIKQSLAKGWLRDPQVRVEVSKYGSQSVVVQGEVRIPGKVPMTGPLTLMDALVAAGSPTSNASSVVTISRKPRDGEGTAAQKPELIQVNLDDLRKQAVPDIPLQGGDIIIVPKAETFYVQGRVKNVGMYVWEPGLTVQQAITRAGGIDEKGRMSGLKVTRIVDGKLKEIEITPTDLVQANDSIQVPQRRF